MFGGRRAVVEMPADGPVTASGGELGYGGFWARFAALVVDNAILMIPALVLVVAASFVDAGFADLVSWVYVLASLLYWPLMESSARQATFGKQLMGLQVTDAAGQRLSFVRALLRTLAKIISAIPLNIGFLLAAFTSRKQALHDIIVSTLVLRTGESSFMKALAATAGALLITGVGTYYYASSIYLPELEKQAKATQQQMSKPAIKPKPVVEQVQGPGGTAFPADKPAPAPAPVSSAPLKPAGAPPSPEAAPKVAATPPAKEPAAPAKVAVAQAKEPAPKPAASPEAAKPKPVTAELKPATPQAAAKPATAELKPAAAPVPASAKPASPRPARVATAPEAKAKPAPVMTAAAPADEAPAPKAAPEPRAPLPARPPVEVTTVPAAASGPTLAYNDVMTAVMFRDRAAATQLLDLGWWPDRPDSNGVTPLMAAAMNGDADMTELLISRGADARRRGPGGSTLDYAARGGNPKVQDLLRSAGAR